jgi:hypothetical protein
MPASKTQERSERSPIHINPTDKVFTCLIDKFGRPSAVPGAKHGQKCIVIMFEEEE